MNKKILLCLFLVFFKNILFCSENNHKRNKRKLDETGDNYLHYFDPENLSIQQQIVNSTYDQFPKDLVSIIADYADENFIESWAFEWKENFARYDKNQVGLTDYIYRLLNFLYEDFFTCLSISELKQITHRENSMWNTSGYPDWIKLIDQIKNFRKLLGLYNSSLAGYFAQYNTDDLVYKKNIRFLLSLKLKSFLYVYKYLYELEPEKLPKDKIKSSQEIENQIKPIFDILNN